MSNKSLLPVDVQNMTFPIRVEAINIILFKKCDGGFGKIVTVFNEPRRSEQGAQPPQLPIEP